ncbi:MAG: NAD(P)/FAD-dependent oxidoreductase [Chloroflexota bacterium]
MRRVLILGGGFGGIAAAIRLRERLPPEEEILLVDRRPYFMVGFRKTWALIGASPMEAGQRPLAALKRKGIRVIQGAITAIDPQARAAEVEGRRLEADALIVALGADLAPERVPGFQAHAHNLYEAQAILPAAEALRAFRGGRVVIGIFGVPYKCPPAPYEAALLLRGFFNERGVQADIEVFTPQPMSLPVLGQAGCDVVEGRLADYGITFLPNYQAVAVEAGEVVFTAGRRPYDLLLGVPPHRCPQVVAQSGLTDGGEWVPVNPRTLETKFPGVYAIGDVVVIPMADGKPLPKAGIFAEAEGEVVAERIAAVFAGGESQAAFAGEGSCYLEVGNGEAMLVQGRFLDTPAPQVTLLGPSRAYLEEKRAFETERLQKWFG